jgi:hypothetical protein
VNYPGHYKVDSVNEAIALAEKLAAAGEYNIFRGQTADWPMRSSYCRLASPELDGAQKRFLEFAAFIEKTSELASLHRDRFGVMAIAQHYGIPTLLVDFTTSPTVAGWFASHGNPKEGRPSVIYLAHDEYIAQQYRDTLPQLRLLRIAVDNLWRLQAQSGLFLHLPFANDPELDGWLAEGFGSIRFPYRGPATDIPESAIYPARKSRLEVLFDGFITEENLRKEHANLKAMGLRIIRPPETEQPRPAPAFVGDYAPPAHGSWTQSKLMAWLRPPPENFRRQDSPPELTLEVTANALKSPDSRTLQRQLAACIQQFIATQKNARMGFVNFHLQLDSKTWLDDCVHPDSRLRRTVKQDLADCWDGMRCFPYDDTVISNALAYLAMAWARIHGCRQSLHQIVQDFLGPDELLAEFGLAVGGQHAIAPVPKTEFIAALRDDLLDLLKPEFHNFRTAPSKLLHQVTEPRRLFDLDRFVTLFGYRLVPGQFLFRQRNVVFFSPAEIQRLGNR